MANFVDTLKTIGPARLSIVFGIAVLLLGFFLYVMARMSNPNMQLLYADLETQDSAKIVAELEQQKIPYQLRADGKQIYVAESKVGGLRLKLAADGIPGGGSVGYEIFDKGEGFGASSFILNVKHVRALEGELARSIRAMDSVAAARVHLVLPQRELFSRETQAPSASVVLKLRRTLDRGQINAVQHLIAAAVPQLQPTQVVIVDDRGNMLAAGFEDPNSSSTVIQRSNELRQNTEMRLSSAIEQLLAKSLGSNNAKVQVSAELDMQRITTNREKFDPESKVERSTQNNNESSQENNKEGSSAVSAGSNLPATTTGGAAAPQNSQNSQSNRTSETVNYEISKVITNEVQEPGQIKRLSVAVLVNNKETKKEDGTVSSEPRSAEELTQLQDLVKTAAGFDEKRGDTVKVVNLPFSATIEPLPEESSSLMGFTKEDIKDVLEMVILSVVAMLVLLIVVRPFLNKIMQPIGASIGDGSAANAMLGSPASQARVLQQQGMPMPAITAPGAFNEQQTEMPDTSEMDEMVNLARVSGQVKAATVRQIGDLIEKNTDDSVAVIRNWLYQEPAKGNS